MIMAVAPLLLIMDERFTLLHVIAGLATTGLTNANREQFNVQMNQFSRLLFQHNKFSSSSLIIQRFHQESVKKNQKRIDMAMICTRMRNLCVNGRKIIKKMIH